MSATSAAMRKRRCPVLVQRHVRRGARLGAFVDLGTLHPAAQRVDRNAELPDSRADTVPPTRLITNVQNHPDRMLLQRNGILPQLRHDPSCFRDDQSPRQTKGETSPSVLPLAAFHLPRSVGPARGTRQARQRRRARHALADSANGLPDAGNGESHPLRTEDATRRGEAPGTTGRGPCPCCAEASSRARSRR